MTEFSFLGKLSLLIFSWLGLFVTRLYFYPIGASMWHNVCLKSIGCTLSQGTHWKTMMCAKIYGARNILSFSPLTFFSSPSIVWFLANHHVFPHSHTNLFFYLLCSSLSHVISPPSSLHLPLCTLFSPSHSLEVLLFFLCSLEVSTSFALSLIHSSSLSHCPNKHTHTKQSALMKH